MATYHAPASASAGEDPADLFVSSQVSASTMATVDQDAWEDYVWNELSSDRGPTFPNCIIRVIVLLAQARVQSAQELLDVPIHELRATYRGIRMNISEEGSLALELAAKRQTVQTESANPFPSRAKTDVDPTPNHSSANPGKQRVFSQKQSPFHLLLGNRAIAVTLAREFLSPLSLFDLAIACKYTFVSLKQECLRAWADTIVRHLDILPGGVASLPVPTPSPTTSEAEAAAALAYAEQHFGV